MTRLFLTILTLVGLISSLKAQARDKGQPIILDTSALSFEFADQDGQISYPCTYTTIASANDINVKCSRADQPNVSWSFTVHARLFMHPHTASPKLSYELLYWITDHQVPSGDQGKYPGTTLWLNLDEPSQLVSFDISQDIETTWVLKMSLRLKPVRRTETNVSHFQVL
jgi:hypothetical protein